MGQGRENNKGQPPNILVLMSDQHQRNASGIYGHPIVKTPNIDDLAKVGTRFTNAYCTSPICVPARASLATGRYVNELKTWDNAAPYIGQRASWGHRLLEKGYAVITIGKLHYRRQEDPTGFPDQRIPLHIEGGVGDIYALVRNDMPVLTKARERIFDCGMGESAYTEYDRKVAAEAESFLFNEARQIGRPWALMVSFVTPHFPWIVPEPYYRLYEDSLEIDFPIQYGISERPKHPVLEEMRHVFGLDDALPEEVIKKARRAYYGLCTFMDAQVGAVINALRISGSDRTTRIIYTSDHGDSLGDHGLWWKHTMYEGSVGVPLIISGPGISAGAVCSNPVSHIDVFPTIVNWAGCKSPDEDADLPGRRLDVDDRGLKLDARPILAEYHARGSITGIFMLRYGKFKYVHYVGFQPQLFDLHNDPNELNDLSQLGDYKESMLDCEKELRGMVNPDEVDRNARKDQAELISKHGGREMVLQFEEQAYTPIPAALCKPDTEASTTCGTNSGGERRDVT